MLCKDCIYYKSNGTKTTIGLIYNKPELSCGLGNCQLTGALKNEHNSCLLMENKATNEAQQVFDALLEESCRQWCDFIDEDPERKSGEGFAGFFKEICQQKQEEGWDYF